jgi:predicted transcriptional regulator
MKIKRLKVGVRPLAEGLEEFGATLKALQAGKAVPKRTGVYFVSVEAMRQVLTPSRKRIRIRNNRATSIRHP